MQASVFSFAILRLFLACACIPLHTLLLRAQDEFVSAGILYQDAVVKVELEYKIIPCSQNKTSKFRYRITGHPAKVFINWKMSYYNCNDGITYQSNSLDLSSIPRNSNDHIRQDIDWSFSGIKLNRPFYEVKTQTFEDQTPASTGPVPLSVQPVRINGRELIEAGEKITLTQEGGKLAEAAQWHWYANSCEGQPIGTGDSITVAPSKNTVYYVRAQWFDGSTDCASFLVKINTGSAAADSIEGRNIFCKGADAAQLKVMGGRLLKSAHWSWYADSIAGQPIGTGPILNIAPRQTTSYFVRAESAHNITQSRSKTIRVIEGKSEDPSAISGLAEICHDSLLQLNVVGGKLAGDAEWAWYHDAVTPANLEGKGAQFSKAAVSSIVYYVQAEGICGATTPRSFQITVLSAAIAPESIIADSSAKMRLGGKIKLIVRGGSLGSGSKWVWYKNTCGGDSIGTGEYILVNADHEKNYFIRAEGPCNNTSCVMHHVTRLSQSSLFINFGIIPSFRSAAGNNNTGASTVSSKSGLSRAFAQASYGLTAGKMRTTVGWYIRVKYSVISKNPLYTTNDKALTDYRSTSNYYAFNGETDEARLGVTAGGLLNLTKNTLNTLLLNTGLGYGKRTLSWAITEYSYQSGLPVDKQWAKNQAGSFAGPEAELGLVLKLHRCNFIVGGNFIFNLSHDKGTATNRQNLFTDMYAGIGFNF